MLKKFVCISVLILEVYSSLLKGQDGYGPWRKVYDNGLETYVSISFKINQRSCTNSSFYRLSVSKGLKKCTCYLMFSFDYKNCDGKTATQNITLNIGEDAKTGVLQSMGYWFNATQIVTPYYNVRLTPPCNKCDDVAPVANNKVTQVQEKDNPYIYSSQNTKKYDNNQSYNYQPDKEKANKEIRSPSPTTAGSTKDMHTTYAPLKSNPETNNKLLSTPSKVNTVISKNAIRPTTKPKRPPSRIAGEVFGFFSATVKMNDLNDEDCVLGPIFHFKCRPGPGCCYPERSEILTQCDALINAINKKYRRPSIRSVTLYFAGAGGYMKQHIELNMPMCVSEGDDDANSLRKNPQVYENVEENRNRMRCKFRIDSFDE